MFWNKNLTFLYPLLIATCNAAKDWDSWIPYYNSTLISLNVTGAISFPPPLYTNDTNTPQNWTLRNGLGFVKTVNPTNVSIAERIWIESPSNTVQQNRPNQAIEVVRDVCWVAFSGARIRPQHTRKNDTGNNGCDALWGGTCSELMSGIIKNGFKTAVNANGSLDCSATSFDFTGFAFWNIRDICNIYTVGGRLTGGKLATFNPDENFHVTLIYDSVTSTHSYTPFAEGNDTLHGNYTSNYLLETGLTTSSADLDTYPNFTSAYDSAAGSFDHMFFVTGPQRGGDINQLDVSMVCVKYSQVSNGSRPIPKDSTGAGTASTTIPISNCIVLIFLITLLI